MTIRTILVPFDGSEAAKLVMELGLRFGKDHGANVRVLNVRSDPKDTISLLGEGMAVSMSEDMIQAAEKDGGERAVRGRKMFDALVKELSLKVSDEPRASGASASWSEEVGREDEVTARQGRLADLIVVMAAGRVDHPAVARGIAFLAQTQNGEGLWDETRFTAVGFPRVFYLRYHGYSKFFPLWALARYRNLSAGNSRTVSVGM